MRASNLVTAVFSAATMLLCASASAQENKAASNQPPHATTIYATVGGDCKKIIADVCPGDTPLQAGLTKMQAGGVLAGFCGGKGELVQKCLRPVSGPVSGSAAVPVSGGPTR